MNAFLVAVVVAVLFVCGQAFTGPLRGFSNKIVAPAVCTRGTELMACRRNNKMEKRRRNRDYARKFAIAAGGNRKIAVTEAKRGVVAAAEDKFQLSVYKMTTDDDMPAYSGFDFI
ncbi:hypothetical protein B484DRAFT_391281 [Ochromonadaceae sp. CCMP2298]|nr:hypothetical protein B484DRAFT_391281 [Ochromonadaceae sp. CCMP2298]